MPRRVRAYGSAEDAEAAALAQGRPGAGDEPMGELASTMTAREIASHAAEVTRALNDLISDGTDPASLDDVREIIASLERMSQDLPELCEQLARTLVVRREDGQIGDGAGPDAADPDLWVAEVVDALAAAGQAADMMTAALTEAGKASAELSPAV